MKRCCPNCGNELADGEKRVYKPLTDHVSHPNQDTARELPTYKCTNEECILAEYDVLFGKTGDLVEENGLMDDCGCEKFFELVEGDFFVR